MAVTACCFGIFALELSNAAPWRVRASDAKHMFLAASILFLCSYTMFLVVASDTREITKFVLHGDSFRGKLEARITKLKEKLQLKLNR